MAHETQQKRLNILDYWQIIIAIVMIIAGWVSIQNKQANADLRLDKVETKQIANDETNTKILVQLSAIQSDLSWVKSALSNSNKAKMQ